MCVNENLEIDKNTIKSISLVWVLNSMSKLKITDSCVKVDKPSVKYVKEEIFVNSLI